MEGASPPNFRQTGVGSRGKGTLIKGKAHVPVDGMATTSIPSKFETILFTGGGSTEGFNSRATRFRSDVSDAPGPGAYYAAGTLETMSDSLSKKGFGNGFVSKTTRFQAETYGPGPGRFDPPDFLQSRTRTDFNRSQTSSAFKSPVSKPVLEATVKVPAPGPGDYSPVKDPGALVRRSRARAFIVQPSRRAGERAASAPLRDTTTSAAAAADYAATYAAALAAARAHGTGHLFDEKTGPGSGSHSLLSESSTALNSSSLMSHNIRSLPPGMLSLDSRPLTGANSPHHTRSLSQSQSLSQSPAMERKTPALNLSAADNNARSPGVGSNAGPGTGASFSGPYAGSAARDAGATIASSSKTATAHAHDELPPFASTERRFKDTVRPGPAPGAYDPPVAIGAHVPDIAAAFRSQTKRNPFSRTIDQAAVPGPGHYTPADPSGEALLEQQDAALRLFKPTALDRFGVPIIRRTSYRDVPGPGAYNTPVSANDIRASTITDEARMRLAHGSPARARREENERDPDVLAGAGPVGYAATGRDPLNGDGGPAMAMDRLRAPGPAYYSPVIVEKEHKSFHLNARRRWV